jgi:thioredoxin-related protein
MLRSVVTSLAFSFLAVAAQAGSDAWTQDFAAAKEKAKAESKDLLIDFTGSDWCIWCKRLDEEVFADSDFEAKIQERFVLVKLDFPKNKELVTADVAKQNEALMAEFGVRGFPTIFLTTADGKPYARTGYEAGGAANYLDHVAELGAVKDEYVTARAAADGKEGADRATALAEALDLLDDQMLMPFYEAEVREIIALDVDGAAGLKDRFQAMVDAHEMASIQREINTAIESLAQKGDWDAVIATLDEKAKAYESKPKAAQLALYIKAMALAETKKFDLAIETVKKARDLDPTTELATNAEMVIAQLQAAADQSAGEVEEETEEDG